MHPSPGRFLVDLVLLCAVVGVVTTRGDSQPAADLEAPLRIDHRAVAEFDRLSDGEIQAASGMKVLLRSASIGWNIDHGLSCLMNSFPGRSRRPNACDRRIPAEQVVYGAKYDRRNWRIELRGNPGWYGKLSDFVNRIDRLTTAEPVDVVGFNFNYSDGVAGSRIVEQFLSTTPNAQPGNVATLEALEQRHAGKIFVWWSMALPRRSSATMQQFNERIRIYAVEHGKILFDLADIESHGPDGTPCTDNQGSGLEALCQQYTDERDSGHLNALGSQRVAKAMWVLMARLTG